MSKKHRAIAKFIACVVWRSWDLGSAFSYGPGYTIQDRTVLIIFPSYPSDNHRIWDVC